MIINICSIIKCHSYIMIVNVIIIFLVLVIDYVNIE